MEAHSVPVYFHDQTSLTGSYSMFYMEKLERICEGLPKNYDSSGLPNLILLWLGGGPLHFALDMLAVKWEGDQSTKWE